MSGWLQFSLSVCVCVCVCVYGGGGDLVPELIQRSSE